MDPNNTNHILIESTPCSPRPLLFSLALHQARRDRSVLYIASAPLDQIPGGLNAAEARDARLARRIHFMYVPSSRELCERLAQLQTWSLRPALVIVEALDVFCAFGRRGAGGGGGSETALLHAAAVVATLHDYAAVVKAQTVCSISARDVVGNKNVNVPDVLTTLQRLYYFQDNCFALAAGKEAEDQLYVNVIKYLVD